jgi:Holliday junction resolvasome RuvABC endonuclease subunit
MTRNNNKGAKAPHIIGIDPGIRNVGVIFSEGIRIIDAHTFKNTEYMLIALLLYIKKFHPVVVMEDILLYRPNVNAKEIIKFIGKVELLCRWNGCQLMEYIPKVKDKVKITSDIEREMEKLKDKHQRDAYLLVCYYVQSELNPLS